MNIKIASFPVFDRLQYAKTAQPGESADVIRGTVVNCHHAFSQYAKPFKRPILGSVLATYEDGQVPVESYTKRMKHTQARSHGSKVLLSDKCEYSSSDAIRAKRRHYLELNRL